MTTQRLSLIGKWTALISFLGGIFIFLLYYLTSADSLLFLGYGFIAIVGLINLGLLISLFVRASHDKDNRKKIYSTCGLLLLNIPIMLSYCWFAIILLATMRITFINTSQTKLSDIQTIGCDSKHIDSLQPGQSQTIWVGINGDCALDIEYFANGQKKIETVAGYLTSGMGQKLTFNIGTDQKPF